jgi:FtsH-binding integral membrane protein
LEERDAESGLYEDIDFESEFTELEKLTFARAVIGIVAFQFLIATAFVIPASFSTPSNCSYLDPTNTKYANECKWRNENCPALNTFTSPLSWWNQGCHSFGTFFVRPCVLWPSCVVYLASWVALLVSRKLRGQKYWNLVVLLILTLAQAFLFASFASFPAFDPEQVRSGTLNFFGLLLFIEESLWLWKEIATVQKAVFGGTTLVAVIVLVISIIRNWGEEQLWWSVGAFFTAFVLAAYVYVDVFHFMIKGRHNMKIIRTQSNKKFPWDTYIFCALLLYADFIRLIVVILIYLWRCLRYCWTC